MKEIIRQYKNLIIVVVAVLLVIGLIAADPLGFVTERRHQRAVIQNQMAIEKAEADKQIAIIKAQTDAELKRIQDCLPVTETEAEPEVVTLAPDTMEESE